MHTKEDKGHGKQIKILPVNDVPLVGGFWLVDVYVRKETERKNHDSEVDPREKEHKNDKSCNGFVLADVGLHIDSSACHKNIAGVMDNEDHNSCRDFVAHHREKNEACSHKMMQHPFVVFGLTFCLNNH